MTRDANDPLSEVPSAGDGDEIPVLRPMLPTAEQLRPYLSRIDASRCYANWGPLASELEERLADCFGIPSHGVVSASSGTTALVGAILATAGRATVEKPFAILPALTFVATALAVEQCGYQIHLVDVTSDDWTADPDALSDHPLLSRVGVVVPVSTYGRRLVHDPWNDFRRRTGIPVVIDGAASFEALSRRETALSQLPIVLSFHATKAFATGEGGCVVTMDTRLAESVTRALNFGFFEDRECRAASTNGKMSEYHAAVGLAELGTWPTKHRNLLRVADTYKRLMREASLASRILTAPEIASCYVLYRGVDVVEVDCVKKALIARRIEFRSWYGAGVHRQPYFSDASCDALPLTDHLTPLLLGLPVAPDLDDSDVARVVEALECGVTRSR